MGTFHHDRGELHGITVVVDTHGPQIWIGRCDVYDDRGIVLLDVDVHAEGEGGKSKADYVRRAAMVGVWKQHERIVLPAGEIASVKRLGEF